MPPEVSRGRVVMLVDSIVDGDSRVQKTAASVAELGWQVTVIGRAPGTGPDTFTLGRATVRRVTVPYPLYGHLRRNPGFSLRWPLAYRTAAHVQVARARLNGLRLDLASRRPASSGPSALGYHALRGWYLLRRLHVGVRTRENQRATRRRVKRDGWADTAGAWVWHRLRGRGSWRRIEPILTDFELAYAPLIDKIRPDIIHAHDYRMVGTAVRAARRARTQGRTVRVVYDSHEYLPGTLRQSRRWLLGNEAYEREYAPQADAVITVSERLSELLVKRHKLTVDPVVVLNAPATAPVEARPGFVDIRGRCGLAPDVPLLVYSGSPAPQRGLLTVVEALAELPDAHAALIVLRADFRTERPDGTREVTYAPLVSLRARAVALGVADRLHLLDYVPQDHVVPFIRGADLGVIPIHHQLNHEIALITKYLEYAQAGLPIVTSDVETMARTTTEVGNGEVFVAEDTADFARAVRAVLSDPVRYRAPYQQPGLLESWSWPAQERTLEKVYTELTRTFAGGAERRS